MRLLTVGGKVVSVSGKAIEIPDSSGGVYQIAVETSAGHLFQHQKAQRQFPGRQTPAVVAH